MARKLSRFYKMARRQNVFDPRWIKLFTQTHWSPSDHNCNGYFKLVVALP